jgi:chemotaxis protein MotB
MSTDSNVKRRFDDAGNLQTDINEQESWVLSYVDLLLLMVTLFVLLLSYQQQELKKAQEQQVTVEPVYTLKPTLVDQVYVTGLKGKVSFIEENNRVRLAMSDHILFLPGDANLSHSGEQVLDELAAMLKKRPSKILVEGHTDNQGISTPRFQSNWELSSARASSVTRHLISMGISPARLSAIGYADTRPLEENNTKIGRTKNRRVELVLTALE